MKSNTVYIVWGLLILAAVAGYFIYANVNERSAVAECSASASQAIKTNNPQTASEGDQIYNVFFKACMGKRGFER